MRTIRTDRAPGAIGPYSQAIVHGDLVFCSGQIALDVASGQVVEGDVGAQTAQALANLGAVLEAAGTSVAHVVKTTVFLTTMDDFAHMNQAYERVFSAHKPARSTVAVVGLPRGVRVEIEAIAAIPAP